MSGVYPTMGEDTLNVRWNGAGGYGDPLARDPQDVYGAIPDKLAAGLRAGEIRN